MISVVIPTLDAGPGLVSTLTALVPATVQGLVREVIIVDGGSKDQTASIASNAGARFIGSKRGRGTQLATGAREARFDWLLFLHADTVLQPGWEREAAAFIELIDCGNQPASAAAFGFALDDVGFKPRLVETLVRMRCFFLRLPYGDQGLLLSKRLYERIGGYNSIPLMEDVDLVRRLGRKRLIMLRSQAVTSAVRYQREGYAARILSNLVCMALFYLRVPPETLRRIYG